MNHGHVKPNADGSRARCGGPAICSVCALEQAQAIASVKPTNRNIESGDVLGVLNEVFNNWYEREVDASTTLHDAFLVGYVHAMAKVQGLVEALEMIRDGKPGANVEDCPEWAEKALREFKGEK